MHIRERQLRLARVSSELEVKLGREPTAAELAEATGLSIEHVSLALSPARTAVSLNQPVGQDESSQVGDLLADPAAPIRSRRQTAPSAASACAPRWHHCPLGSGRSSNSGRLLAVDTPHLLNSTIPVAFWWKRDARQCLASRECRDAGRA
jgi:hypothetical protein